MEWFSVWWENLGMLGRIFAYSAIPMTVVMVLQFILLLIGVGFGSDADGDVEVDSDTGADFDTDGEMGLDGNIDFSVDTGIDTDIDTGIDTDVDTDIDTDGDAVLGEISSYMDRSVKEVDSRGSFSILKVFTIRGIVAFFALGGWAGIAALSAGISAFWSVQIAVFAGVSALLLASIVIRLALRMQESGNINLKNTLEQTAEVYIRIPPARSEKGKVTMLLQERFVEIDAITDCDVELLPQSMVEVVALADGDCLVVRPISDNE